MGLRSSKSSIQDIEILVRDLLVLKSGNTKRHKMQRKLEIPGKTKPYVMAHRGNRVQCPENTLTAFQQAFKDGADILETDLHLSKDGQFICIHDGTLDRTTDRTGRIEDLTATEIKQASAFNHMPGFEKERVPFLPEDVALALELKSDRFLEEDICRRLVGALKDAGVLERTIVLSFSMSRILTVRKTAADMPIGLITMKKIVPPPQVDMVGPFFPILWLNPFYLHTAHDRGLLVCPLDPVPEARLKHYLRIGCDAIITDNSAVTCQAVEDLLPVLHPEKGK